MDDATADILLQIKAEGQAAYEEATENPRVRARSAAQIRKDVEPVLVGKRVWDSPPVRLALAISDLTYLIESLQRPERR